jgi:hypothetical protein
MKLYIIRETTGYPTVIRNGQVVQLALGEEFTEDELDSLTCETYVTYICKETSVVATKRAGEQKPAPVVEKPAPVVKSAPAPAPKPAAQEEEPAAE